MFNGTVVVMLVEGSSEWCFFVICLSEVVNGWVPEIVALPLTGRVVERVDAPPWKTEHANFEVLLLQFQLKIQL